MKMRIKWTFLRALCAVTSAALLCAGLCLSGCGAGTDDEGTPAAKPASAPAVPADYAELYEQVERLLSGGYDEVVYNGTAEAVFEADEAEVPMAPETAVTTAAASAQLDDYVKSEESYSGTNVQVDGVDEGDILKTDGNYIYLLRSGRLTIADAKSMTELCTAELDLTKYGSVYELYVSGDRLAVIAGYDLWYKTYVLNGFNTPENDGDAPYGSETAVAVFDISDRTAPKEVCLLTQDGSYASSRMSGGYIYCVTNDYLYGYSPDPERPETFVPSVSAECDGIVAAEALPPSDICLFDDCNEACYTVLTSCRLADCSSHSSAKAAFGRAGSIYCDGEVMLISAARYTTEQTEGKTDGKNTVTRTSTAGTDLMLYSLGENGEVSPIGSGSVPGTLVNQFAIDRYNGYFRFVTTVDVSKEVIYTDGIDTYDYENSRACALYVTDGGLNTVGSIEDLAEGEQVYSARFYGDIAYFVTFRQTDPLFCADLSDPVSPRILGELKLPGFSEYLHRYSDTLLLGLGRSADEDTGIADYVKLSMFDISDPANVVEKDKLTTESWYSEALYDHRAILVSPEKGLIAFSLDNSAYVVYTYDGQNGFSELCRLEEDGKWHSFYRGLFIGSGFYICRENSINRYDMDNGFAPDGRLELSVIAQPEGGDIIVYDEIDY